MLPEDAVRFAAKSPLPKILISDTGDNITAGCAGDQALLTFPGDGSDINAALLSQQDKKQAVDKALSEAFGREVHAQFGSGAPAAPTGPTKDARQKLDAVYDAFPREGIELTDDPG